MLGAVLRFGVAICILSVFQGLLVAFPAARPLPALGRLRSGWWALLPVASVAGFVLAGRAISATADGLAYLALLTVPPLAAVAAGWAMRGARAPLALVAAALFALAWADRTGLAGEAAAALLEGLSCVTLAVLLVALTPRLLVKLGIVAMAAVDTWLVVSDLLQAPNNALNAAAPLAHLPQLQRAVLGSAVMGYGDLFIAALFGALLAAQPRLALRGALAVGLVALASDALFFAVNELPATVPVALVLVAHEAHLARARRRGAR
jgi:hypothetical protein